LSSPELFVRNHAQRRKRQLTKLTGLNTAAAWSADGKHLVFLHREIADMRMVSSLDIMPTGRARRRF
jgi:Tol biopolymer transport system component